jgi:hypothetical protein
MSRFITATSSGGKVSATVTALSGNYTIAWWFNPNWNSGDSTRHYWLEIYTGAFTSPYLAAYHYSDNTCNVVDSAGGAVSFADTGIFTAGTWVHMAVVNDATHMTWYINGVQKAQGTALTVCGTKLDIGAGDIAAFATRAEGSIADFAMWTTNLSSSQIAQLAAGYRPVDANATLQNWWPIGGYQIPEPDVFAGNNATVPFPAEAYQSPMPPSLGRGGRNLNAGTNVMQNTSIVVPAVNGQSMATWVYATSLASLGNILRCNPGDSVQGIYITGSGSAISFSGTILVLSTSTLNTNTWYHLAVTLNAAANNTILYLNGASVASGNATDHLLLAGTKTLGAGYVGSANPLTGYVADQAFWTTELTSTDVANLYAGRRPNSIQSASLLTWWPCDGFSNATEPDRSGHGYDYTITGGVTPLLGPPQLWRLG